MPQAAESPDAELSSCICRLLDQTRDVLPGDCCRGVISELRALPASVPLKKRGRLISLRFLSVSGAMRQAGSLSAESAFASCFISRAASVLVSCLFLFKWAISFSPPSPVFKVTVSS